MFVITYRKIFYTIALVLTVSSIVSMIVFGFNLGIDFKGGSILEIEYVGDRPAVEEVRADLQSLSVEESIRPTGEKGYIIRMKSLTEEERIDVLNVLSSNGSVLIEQKRFDSIGPVLGKEATRKSVASIVLVLVVIVLFIAFVFRKVSKPVSSWKYGIIAIIALAQDIIIPIGAFSVLGHFYGYEIDTLFVTALLVILGFSVHDTIVVFDRIRENLLLNENKTKEFDQIVGSSIRETVTRSVNTSLTVVFALIVLYLVGGEPTQQFTLALLIGVVAGTYSSIFIASPLLVTLQKWQAKKNNS